MPPDGQKPDGQEQKPMPDRADRAAKKEIEVPPEAKKLIQARSGFANYYFNELNRKRVWDAFAAHGNFAAIGGAWKLTGDLAVGGQVEVMLSDSASTGSFPQGTIKLDAAGDLDQQPGPAGSGGLLVALHLWRQMLVEGPEKFGNVVYYGTAPDAAVEGQAEVLEATRNVAEMHLIFEPTSGELAAIEVIVDATEDGCVVRFGDYREVHGRRFPHRIEVRHGDDLYGQIQWKQIELASSPEVKP